jgi:hypothetical protein
MASSFLEIMDLESQPLETAISELSIPIAAKNTLPIPTLSVTEFCRLDIPIVPSTLHHPAVNQCWSREPPNADPCHPRVLPPVEWVREACRSVNEAQKGGMQSIFDWRRPSHRYPLWAPFLWIKWAECNNEQDGWAASDRWVSIHSKRPSTALAQADEVRDMLASLPWGVKITAHGACAEMGVFRRLLSDDWLSDDIINMAMYWLASRTRMDEHYRTVIITPLSVQHNIMAAASSGNYNFALLRRYQHEILVGQRRLVYLPLHVGGNHWIMALLDFEHRTLSYGECICF